MRMLTGQRKAAEGEYPIFFYNCKFSVILHRVIRLLDNVVASRTKRQKLSAVMLCIIERTHRRQLGCDFVRTHRIYATATLPFFYFL